MAVLRGRSRRAAFWHLGRERLVCAVLERGGEEPLLVACVGFHVDASATVFCPGLFEAVRATESVRLPHVVGLGAEVCALEEQARDGARCARVAGSELWAVADAEAVAEQEALFAGLGLRVAAIDCEPCARATLDAHLGSSRGAADPLAAVSVAAACESQAAMLGDALSVPIGLALARLGFDA